MDDQLPSFDEALDGQEKSLPTWDEAYQKHEEETHINVSNNGVVGTALKLGVEFAATGLNTLAGAPTELSDDQRMFVKNQDWYNISKAFGHGYEESFEANAGLDPEDEAYLKKNGQFKNFMDFHDVMNKSFMDGTMVPLSRTIHQTLTAVDTRLSAAVRQAVQLGVGAGMGAIGGVEEAVGEFGKQQTGDIGGYNPIGHALQAGAEYKVIQSGAEMPFHVPEPVLPKEIAVPLSNGAMESEAVYMGLKEPPPERQKVMQEAADMYPEAHSTYFPSEVPERTPDIGTLEGHARGIDKEAFELRDRLTQKVDRLNQWYAEAKEKQTSPFSEDLAKAREKLETGSPKNRKVYAARVAELEEKHAAHLAEGGLTGDADKLWKELQATRGELYDLAGTGRIAKAYREADARLPKVAEQRVEFEEPTEAEMGVPPPEKGFVRMYHGGIKGEGSRWISPDVNYAKQYAEKSEGGKVYYVDVPEDAPYMNKAYDDEGTNMPAPFINTEAPADVMEGAKEHIFGESKITPDAEALLKTVDDGGVPAMMTKNLKRVAEENEIKVTESMTPNDVISALREKQSEPAVDTRPAPERQNDRQQIIEQETAKLLKAGRTAEQAANEAQIQAARYEARAAAFEGKRGTALELYRSEAPDLRAGQQRAVKAAKKNQPKLKFQNERTPILSWMARKGGVNSKSQLAQDLRSMGLGYGKKYTPVGLFRETSIEGKKGAGEFDNFPATEYYNEFGVQPPVTKDGYVQPEWLQEQIQKEVAKQSAEAGAAAYDDIDITNQIQKEVVDAAKEMAVHDLSKSDIAAIADMMRKDISLEAQDAIAEFVEREAIKEFNQSANAKIRLSDGEKKALITVFNGGDASSIIHEYSHSWLEELLKDAEHADAPEQLKKDAEQARKYTGLKKDTEGKEYTKGHEKWARSVERYFLEGVAPSKELAGVFARLKKSMSAVYESIKNFLSLNKNAAQLDDATRAVFDRLLAHNGERTVVSPDFESGEMAANIHEVDATEISNMHSLPEYYAERGDEMETEITASIQKKLEEYANAVIPTETGTGDATAPQSEPVNGSEGGASRVGEAPQAFGESPHQHTGESHSRREPEPVGPATPLGEPKSELVDKAGNIRLDNLNTIGQIKDALRESASRNNDFLENRRGVVSDEQVLSLAESLGMDASWLDKKKIGDAYNAEEIKAVEKMMAQSTQSLADAANIWRQSERLPIDDIEFQKVMARHDMIQGYYSQALAESGRAQRATAKTPEFWNDKTLGVAHFFNDIKANELFQMPIERQTQLILDLGNNTGKINRFTQSMKQPDFMDKIMEYWMNALLSGPKTHMVNITSNAATAIWAVPESLAAAGVGKILGSSERVYANEARARLFGLVEGAKEGIYAAAKAFDTELSSEGAMKLDTPRQAIGGKLGRAIRIPGRLLTAADEFFKHLAYRQEINAMAYRAATKANLEGNAWAVRVTELKMDPTQEMMDSAVKNADYQTFTQKLGPMGQSIQRFTNSNRAVKFIIPFVRTPVNILKYASERTPFGLLSKEVRDNISGVNGTIARDNQIARMALGTMVGVATMSYALEGKITGGGPSNSQEKALLYTTGWQPYSVLIGGKYVPYGRYEPFGTIMGISADLAEIGHAISSDELDRIPAMINTAIQKNLVSKTWLSGVANLIEVFHDPDRYGDKWIQSFAGSAIPSAVNQEAKFQDPILREARTMTDVLKSRIGGLSETLLPRRDLWGQPINRDNTTLKNDPVAIAMQRVKYFPSMPDRKINGVELTDKQYDYLSAVKGSRARMRMAALVQNPSMQNAPVEIQKKLMSKAFEASGDEARKATMLKYPDIPRQAYENKRRALNVH